MIMAQYNQLRPVAFRLNPDIRALPYYFYALQFPEHWKEVLTTVQAELKGRPRDRVRLPIASLNRALRALVPDLIHINKRAEKFGSGSWLYSKVPIDPRALHLIVRAWVEAELVTDSGPEQRWVLDELQTEALQWTRESVDLVVWDTESNGTAKWHDQSFRMLPDLMSTELCEEEIAFDFGPEPLRFRRAPLEPGQAGTELISWPPRQFPDHRGQAWFFSIIVTLTVQTVPLQPFPVIHCDLGVRRWLSQTTFIPGGETSVYLLTGVPWIKGLHYSRSFQVATLRWERVSSPKREYGQSPFRLTWANKLAPILAHLRSPQPFPSPEALAEDPVSSLNPHGQTSAAVVYHNRMRADHGVGPGLMPGDRCPLAEQFAECLAPNLRFTEPLPRVKQYRGVKFPNPFFERPKVDAPSAPHEELCAERRYIIGQSVGNRLTLEIWYQSSSVRKALIRTICEHLGQPQAVMEASYTWDTPEISLSLLLQPLGPMGSELNPNPKISNFAERRRQAITQRVEAVKTQLSTSGRDTGFVGALIELSGADEFDADTDPKLALRLGLAHVKRLTQFITPGDKGSLDYRTKASFLDLLRQLGAQAAPPPLTIEGLPASLNYVGLWLIKQNRFNSLTGTRAIIPAFVYMNSATTEIKATAPGLEGWLSYPEALLAMAQAQSYGFEYRDQVLNFIEQTLKRDIKPMADTLLVCHAQNMQGTWHWLANKNFTPDQLAFGNKPPEPITNWPGLRVVRVRDSNSHQTPEWYAQNEGEFGFSTGLFEMGERVFASTYNKPAQFRRLSPRLSKGGDWIVPRTGKQYASFPEAYAWNPGLFELAVIAHQPGDVPWPWAAVTHALRQAAFHYDEATASPAPLHLAKQIKEYALVVSEGDQET
jgi:hypothetical protein